MTSWYSVSVTVAPEAAEAIEYAFNSLDALGTEINHLRKRNLESLTVVGYFNELPDEERVQDELQYALRVYGLDSETIQQLERNLIEETDWLAEWKKHWRPSEIGSFVIAPPWSEIADDGKIVIRIEPNMAFGTGTHETTQLCLAAIEANYTPGDTFLDVGTGTGILAIAAAKLNLRSHISDVKLETKDSKAGESDHLRSRISNPTLYACDTDEPSVALAAKNADVNGVGDMIEFRLGSIDDATHPHHFICANLTFDVIEPLLQLLIQKAERGLLLSGILAAQREQIVTALERYGVHDPDIEHSGEWLRVIVKF